MLAILTGTEQYSINVRIVPQILSMYITSCILINIISYSIEKNYKENVVTLASGRDACLLQWTQYVCMSGCCRSSNISPPAYLKNYLIRFTHIFTLYRVHPFLDPHHTFYDACFGWQIFCPSVRTLRCTMFELHSTCLFFISRDNDMKKYLGFRLKMLTPNLFRKMKFNTI